MNELIDLKSESLKNELDVQISTAKQYPRDTKACVEEMRYLATIDQETAESCYYVLKRKDKDICGPSIRMAEIALASWGNIHVGKRIVGNNGTTITGQGVCWDLQKNIKADVSADRSIKYANGGTYNVDMQSVTGNAAASIALRNAIFTVIPKAFIDAVYKECRKVAVGEGNLFIKKRSQVFDRFKQMGVESNNILSFFGKQSIETFDEESLADLIGIGTAIKEGIVQVKEAFEMNEDMKTMDVKERISMLTGSK